MTDTAYLEPQALRDADTWVKLCALEDGTFAKAVCDKDVQAQNEQIIALLTSINLQLKAGIKTQSVVSVQIL